MRTTNAHELEAVLALDGPKRVAHFVKRVVDDERAWGLWNDGWVLMRDNDGRDVFPLWPASEYAERCRSGEWSACKVEEIDLQSLLDDLLPKFLERGIMPGVFPTPAGKGVAMNAKELADALRTEQANYE